MSFFKVDVLGGGWLQKGEQCIRESQKGKYGMHHDIYV